MTKKIKVPACFAMVVLGCFIAPQGSQNQDRQPEKCEATSREPDAPEYLVGQVRHTGADKPSEIYLLISVESDQFKKEQMIALARQLKRDFCKEARFSAIIFDDYNAARHVTYLSVTKDMEKAQRGLYHIDRAKNEEYVQFSTARSKPMNEVKIDLTKEP
jgi:hypothetical protein